jgi:hypothetical protein
MNLITPTSAFLARPRAWVGGSGRKPIEAVRSSVLKLKMAGTSSATRLACGRSSGAVMYVVNCCCGSGRPPSIFAPSRDTESRWALLTTRSRNVRVFAPHDAASISSHHNLPLRLTRPDHRRAVRVLDLDPISRWPRPVGCAQPIRHDAFEAHLASVPEDDGPSSSE